MALPYLCVSPEQLLSPCDSHDFCISLSHVPLQEMFTGLLGKWIDEYKRTVRKSKQVKVAMSVEGTAGEDSSWLPRVLGTPASEDRPGGRP